VCLHSAMEACLASATTPTRTLPQTGSRLSLRYDSDDDADHELIEVEGLPLDHFIGLPCEVSSEQQEDLIWSQKSAGIEVVTWNVGSLSSHADGLTDESIRQDVLKIFTGVFEAGTMDKPVDVLVVGLQEVIPLTICNAVLQVVSLTTDDRTSWPSIVHQWVELLTEILDAHPHPLANYVLHGQPVYMFGLLLCVFCRSDLDKTQMKHFRKYRLAVDCCNTGTKGIVACRLSLYDRSFCFINCHLQAMKGHTEKDNIKALQDRLNQIERCWREIHFFVSDNAYELRAHRAVFLLGDTNMRLDLPEDFKCRKEFGKHVQREIAANRWLELRQYDQLTVDVLQGGLEESFKMWLSKERLWKEPLENDAPFPFPPTYRLEVPGPGYSSKRVPAWTDRILYRSHHVRPMRYMSMRQQELLSPSRNLADHDPVYARFEVVCDQINSARFAEFIRSVEPKSSEVGTESSSEEEAAPCMRRT